MQLSGELAHLVLRCRRFVVACPCWPQQPRSCSAALLAPSCPAVGTFKDYAKGKGRSYHCPRCTEVGQAVDLRLNGCRDAAAELHPNPAFNTPSCLLHVLQQRAMQAQAAQVLAQVLASAQQQQAGGGAAPMQE